MILGTAAVITLGKGWGNAPFDVYLLCQVRSSDCIKELPKKHVWESHPPLGGFPNQEVMSLCPWFESRGFRVIFKEQTCKNVQVINHQVPSGVEGNIQNSQLLLETSENLILWRLTGVFYYTEEKNNLFCNFWQTFSLKTQFELCYAQIILTLMMFTKLFLNNDSF